MEEEIHFNAKGNVIDILMKMKAGFEANSKSADAFQKTAVGSLDKINNSLKNVNLASLNQNIQSLGQGFEDLNRPGLDFNTNLQQLSALTGTTGKDLDKLGEKARKSSLEFGGTATDSLNTYKTILSRLGPAIAEDQEALSLMERNVQILSKTMGGDATAAVDALTTGMLQYGVDLSDPMKAQEEMARMMDIMANSAQEGAAEVPQIAAALKVSGVAAKQANVSFVETNAALQLLAKGGKEGSEAGVALRNMLGKMAGKDVIPKDAYKKLKKLGVDMRIVSDTTLPFTDRLRELKKAQADATVIAQVFGVENASAAQILLNSVDAQDELAKKITKTGGAQEQANIVMKSTSEKLARMQAKIDDAKIAFFEMTGGMSAYLGPATDVLRTMTSFAPIFTATKSAVLLLATAQGRAKIAATASAIAERASNAARLISVGVTKAVTAAQWLWNTALSANPIGVVIIAVAALAAGIYALTSALSSETAAERMNAEVKQRVIDKTADQKFELNQLFETLKKAKKGSKEYNDTLAELEKMQPGIVDKYNLQAGALKDINAAQKEMVANIDAIARAEAYKEIAKEEYKAAAKKEAEGPGWGDTLLYGTGASQVNKWSVDAHKRKSKLASQGAAELMSSDEYKRATGKPTQKEQDGLSDQEKLDRANKAGYESWSDYQESDWKWGGSGKKSKLGTPSGYSSSSSDDSDDSSERGTVKSISARIESLMSGDIIINSTNVTEGAAEIRRILTEQLVGVVRDFEVGI